MTRTASRVADMTARTTWTIEHQHIGEDLNDTGDSLYYGRYYIYDEDDQEVASVHGNTDAEAEPRARLIAAAPEMVEALRAIDIGLNDHITTTPMEGRADLRYLQQQARAALKLAEGER